MLADETARSQALEPDKSFIVQAPAGSGKTELLIQRYLKLLGLASFPEEILAMTFTRKAAAEIKERIISALSKAQFNGPPSEEHAKLTWELSKKVLIQDQSREWQLLKNPARLRIVTIDSFCSSLTRRMPLLSKMGSSLRIQENTKDIYRQTAKNILNLAENQTNHYGELVRNILRHIDNSKEDFIKLIVQILEKRDQWMISFFDASSNVETHPLNDDTRHDLEQTMAELIQSRLEKLNNLIKPDIKLSILQLAKYAGENLQDKNPSHPCACLNMLDTFPTPTINQLNHWHGIANLLLTQNNEWRKKPDVRMGFPVSKDRNSNQLKGVFIDLAKNLQNDFILRIELAKVRQFPQPQFTDEEWNLLKCVIRLLSEINKKLKHLFSVKQITDFTEISLSAINSLAQVDEEGQQSPTDLLYYLDCKIRHFLVDEYQDTSYKQEELLTKLTSEWSCEDGKTLFIVGDPKQSIYRFRDAEVGLFIKTQERGLGNLKLKKLNLESNFRSQKKMVDWINACFNKIFPDVTDANLGAISYSPSSAVLPEEVSPAVAYHPVPYNVNKYSISDEEARRLTILVKSLQSKESEKSIAILVRSRTHLTSIVKYFHKANISFKAQSIDSLTDRPAIIDLISLVRALIFIGDRTAWLSTLRAPWCGLSLKDIHLLVELDSTTPIWSLLNSSYRLELLSNDGKIRTKKFVKNIQPFLVNLCSKNFREKLESCWIRLGGPACLQETSAEDIDVFFDKVEELINENQENQFENLGQVLTDLYASNSSAPHNAIQIMTMHKAKGLEFDYVILPGLGKGTKVDKRHLVNWMPHGDKLLLAPIEKKGGDPSPIYQFLSDLDKEKEDYEILRLLYVAATRAKSQLHLFGHLEPSKKNEWKPNSKSLLHKLWPHIEIEWIQKLRTVTESSVSETNLEEAKLKKHSTYRLPVHFTLPVPRESILEGQAVDIKDDKNIEPEFFWAGNSARCLGKVLHRYLQRLAEKNSIGCNSESPELTSQKFLSALLSEGLPIEHAIQATKSGVQAISSIFEDEKGLWILQPHEDAHCEYPLTYYQDNKYIRNIIDRTFVYKGVRWIIDFKAGTHRGEGEDLDIFLNSEAKRYKHQLDRYETVFKTYGETRPIKKALYFPLLKAWREIN